MSVRGRVVPDAELGDIIDNNAHSKHFRKPNESRAERLQGRCTPPNSFCKPENEPWQVDGFNRPCCEMTPKQQLREAALIVHRELDHYVALHNEIFSTQASFGSVVRRLFGWRIPFEQNYSIATDAVTRWTQIDAELHALVATVWHSLTKEEQMFGVALREYAKVLAATVRALEVRQKWLLKKSEGGVLPWRAFRILENEYARGISEYRRLGTEVNRLWHVIE